MEVCWRPDIISIISELEARQYVQLTRLLEIEMPQFVQLKIIERVMDC